MLMNSLSNRLQQLFQARLGIFPGVPDFMSRVLVLGLSMVLPVFSTFAMAMSAVDDRPPVDDRKVAVADGFVRIKVLRGHLRVTGWDRKEIHVSGLLDEELRQFVFEVDGKDARIEVKIPSKSDGWTNEGSDLEIHIPKGSNLDVSAISTDIRITHILNGLEVSNVSGNIVITDVKDRTEISTVSGEVELRNAEGKVRVTTVSGDIEADHTGSGTYRTVSGELRLGDIGEELEVQSVSGDIEVASKSYRRISGQSVSGDVEISGELDIEGVIEINNVSGSIRLQLVGETDARFDIETGAGGSIRNRLTDDEPKTAKYSRNESLKFKMGKGKGEVVLGTASGDITLTR